MYHGDFSRKQKLVEYGFRLPSALDNRPLKPQEFEKVTGQTVYVSATPGKNELSLSKVVAEQLIRPTGWSIRTLKYIRSKARLNIVSKKLKR